MNKERLVAFTDAIIAIAATIMVLELHAPKKISIQSLLGEWPVFFAYVVSFFLIYIVWYSHHNSFEKAKVIGTNTFLLNGLWLFFLTLVPFATSWVGEHSNQTLPELLYVIVLFLWSGAFQLLDNQVIRDNPSETKDVTNHFKMRIILYGGMLIGAVISFIWPVGTLVVIGIMSVIMAIQIINGASGSRRK